MSMTAPREDQTMINIMHDANTIEAIAFAEQKADEIIKKFDGTLIDEISEDDWKNWDISTEVPYFADDDDLKDI